MGVQVCLDGAIDKHRIPETHGQKVIVWMDHVHRPCVVSNPDVLSSVWWEDWKGEPTVDGSSKL